MSGNRVFPLHSQGGTRGVPGRERGVVWVGGGVCLCVCPQVHRGPRGVLSSFRRGRALNLGRTPGHPVSSGGWAPRDVLGPTDLPSAHLRLLGPSVGSLRVRDDVCVRSSLHGFGSLSPRLLFSLSVSLWFCGSPGLCLSHLSSVSRSVRFTLLLPPPPPFYPLLPLPLSTSLCLLPPPFSSPSPFFPSPSSSSGPGSDTHDPLGPQDGSRTMLRRTEERTGSSRLCESWYLSRGTPAQDGGDGSTGDRAWGVVTNVGLLSNEVVSV